MPGRGELAWGRRVAPLARLAALVLLVGLAWRVLVRRFSLPTPVWAAPLFESPLARLVNRPAAVLADAGVSSGMRVLDAGAGPGRLTLPAAERVGPQGEVVALDMQSGMLRRLAQRVAGRGITNVRLLRAGLGQGALRGEAFDRVLLSSVLGEVPDREAALRELGGALKPGGVLTVIEALPDPHFQTQSAVRRLADAAGLEVQCVRGSPLSYRMNLVRPPDARGPVDVPLGRWWYDGPSA